MNENADFQRALALHQAGCAAEAEAIYRQILAAQPDDAGALHLLGAIHEQRGDQAAVEWINRAIAVNPRKAAYHNNLVTPISYQYKRPMFLGQGSGGAMPTPPGIFASFMVQGRALQ
jgi:tetratricopeptide (TPR) repeat protein